MRHNTKVPAKLLRTKCSEKDFTIENKDFDSFQGIIGQERAAGAVQFGLNVQQPGYNIFVCGPNGTGKSTYIKTVVGEIAKNCPVPDDWCYVYNFEEPEHPVAVNLPAGKGIEFKNDIQEFIKELKVIMPKAFSNEQYEKEKNTIIEDYYKKSNDMYEELEKNARAENFAITKTNTGFGSVPLVDGKSLSEEEFDALSAEEKEMWAERGKKVQYLINTFIKQHRLLEKEFKSQLLKLDQELTAHTTENALAELKEKYAKYPKVINFLNSVQADIIKNSDLFLPKEEEQNILPLFKKDPEDTFKRYKVNLLVDNSQLKGAPVVIETTPNYQNITGSMEFHGEFGIFVTDFTRIRRGALHQANGGYLILQAADVLKYPLVWDAIKTALLNKEVKIGDVSKNLGLSVTATLHPEPIPLQTKVILIGEESLYYLLYHYDPDFKKLFKIKAEFDIHMQRTPENIAKYATFIISVAKQNKLKEFTKKAIARIIDYGSEVAGDQSKLTTKFNKIAEVVYEADAWARIMQAKKVTDEHVRKALTEKIARSNLYEEKIQELLVNGTILIDLSGEKIGEINALAVYSLGDYAFGKPSKITAKTYMGRSGVINIEREASMSGSIHNKGVLILSGFLGEKFAKDKPLALTASIAFEQSYSGVDGDSASAAELLAILSSLAEIPIKQNYAITGSINQNGDIQPIGGVNEKIEGFYKLCRAKGLSGQGVIIPAQNVRNLMLSEEIVEAAKNGEFSVHAVKSIDEAIEIITGVTSAQVYRAVNKKLASWAKDSKNTRKRKKN